MPASHRLIQTFLTEVVGNGKLDLIPSIAREDMIDEANRAFDGPPGIDGLVAHVKGFRRNIANATLEIVEVAGDESSVMAWWTFRGNHVGPWLDLAPSGEVITGTVFSFFRLQDGLISHYRLWLHSDAEGGVTFDSRQPVR